MKVSKMQKAEGPLVSVKAASSVQRIESIDEIPSKDSWQAVLARSMSERPDEIFDMFERYTSPMHSFSPRETKTEEREGCDVSHDDRNEREETERRYQGQGNHDNYIVDLIEKLMLQGIQGYPNTKSTEGAGSNKKDANENKMRKLEEKLEKEKLKSKALAQTLEKAEAKHKEDSLDNEKKLAALEVRMTLQERTHANRIESEHRRMRSLEERLRDIEENDSAKRNEKETSPSVEALRHEELQQKVRDLEAEVADLDTKRVAVEAASESRQSTDDYFITAANGEIKKLEQSQAEHQKIYEAEKAQSKKLELAVSKTEAMLEVDRKKLQTLQRSEKRNSLLLDAERKRVETLEKLNDKMKIAMRKLTKKIPMLARAQDQIMRLTKELERKSSMISSIKRILHVDLDAYPIQADETEPRPFHGNETENGETYIAQSGLARADPIIITEDQEDPEAHGDSSPSEEALFDVWDK
jgi:hypothetical protein